MKTQIKNEIKNVLNALDYFFTRKDEEFTPLHFDRAIVDPFKISYINGGKLKGLKENGIIKSNISRNIRNKHFKALTIEKFFSDFYTDIDSSSYQFTKITDNFKRKFFKNINLKLEIFDNQVIPEIYQDELDNYHTLQNSSCMRKGQAEIEWLSIYRYCTNLQICCLVDEQKNIVARVLLWANDDKSKYFLDRIYICNSLSFGNNSEQHYQFLLYQKVLKHLDLSADKLNTYNKPQLRAEFRLLKQDDEFRLIDENTSSYPPFDVQLKNGFCFSEFPYMDTFQNLSECGILSYDEHSDFVLNQTGGGAEGYDTATCDCCGYMVSDDESCYSEVEGEALCENCAAYIEERDDYCRSENATYNSYSGNYIYTPDIY